MMRPRTPGGRSSNSIVVRCVVNWKWRGKIQDDMDGAYENVARVRVQVKVQPRPIETSTLISLLLEWTQNACGRGSISDLEPLLR